MTFVVLNIGNFLQMHELATMSDLVVKGIEQAQEDLRRETDDALWKEGILRHVPIVGSIYNWISPVQKVWLFPGMDKSVLDP